MVPVEAMFVEDGGIGDASASGVVVGDKVDVIGVFEFDESGVGIVIHFILGDDLNVLGFVLIRIEDVHGGDILSDASGEKVDRVGFRCTKQVSIAVGIDHSRIHIFNVFPFKTVV